MMFLLNFLLLFDIPLLNAPDFGNVKFINSEKSYKLKDFQGKIVLLDFWTYGCINCMHVIKDLKKLEEDFQKELTVIGIHSAKFDSEGEEENLKTIIKKFKLNHLILNDKDYEIWENYAIRAWPTFVLITPDSKIYKYYSGEGNYEAVKDDILLLKKKYKDKLTDKSFDLKTEEKPKGNLYFPEKIAFDSVNNILFVSSNSENMIKGFDLKTKKVIYTIGTGKEGNNCSTFETSTFKNPKGLYFYNNKLYIADTGNHSIKEADFKTKKITLIAGDGKQGYYLTVEEDNPLKVSLNSPWDLIINNNILYFANAGSHQLMEMNLKTNKIDVFAGIIRENIIDGNKNEKANLAQPTGIDYFDNKIYFTDAETSSLRFVEGDNVKTIVGKGLFKFGNINGSFDKALFKHAEGLTYFDNKIYVADTYNDSIKIVDLNKKEVSLLPVKNLRHPTDVLVIDDNLYISNSFKHEIVIFNFKTEKTDVIK